MAETSRALWLLFRRSWLETLRRPVTLTFNFAQPLIWMAFFGFLFQRIADARALGGLDYLSFVAPGVSLMTVLLGASQAGVPLIRDQQSGYLRRLLCTSTAPAVILAGKLAADSSRLLLQSLVVLALGAVLGAALSLHLEALPMALLALVLFAIGLSSLSCCVALIAREPEPMGTYVHLVNMPLLFTSTALVPVRRMPEWLAAVAAYNPMSLVVECWRAAWLGTPIPPASTLLIPALLAVIAFTLAALSMSRMARQP